MKKNTALFTLLLFLSTSLLTTITTSVKAMVVPNPQALVIKEFKGNLYQMTREEWRDVAVIEDLEGHEVKAKDWYKIIKSGSAKEANALLGALGQFLDKDEIWPYVEAGLLRKNNPSISVDDQVANKAYQAWSLRNNSKTLESTRTNPAFAQNLTKYVNWDVLFRHPSKEQLSLDDAIHRLRTTSLLNKDDYNGKRLRYQAINRIAMHTKTDDLLPLIKDENFEVALGSWVALSKLAPKQVAKTVVDHSLWLPDEIQYTYGSGCTRMSAKLIPVVAALDLYIDYLSAEQIKQVLTEVPDMWEQNKFDMLEVTHPKIKPIVLSIKANNPEFIYLDPFLKRWQAEDKHKQSYEAYLPISDIYHAISYAESNEFDSNLKTYLSKKLLQPTSFEEVNINIFIHDALQDHNPESTEFLKNLINSDYFSQNETNMYHDFLAYKDIWPKAWLPIKKQLIEKLQHEILKDDHASITIQFAIQ